MRKILVALMLAVLPLAGLSAAASAATTPTAEQQLLLKKKQAAADARKKAEAKKAEKPADSVTEAGFYLSGNLIYKVKVSEQGNLYAMRRDENGWVYERGAINALRATEKVTPEVAMEYGVRTGICLFCNAELDDKDGYGHRVGVGPVCAKKHLGMTQKQLAERLGV